MYTIFFVSAKNKSRTRKKKQETCFFWNLWLPVMCAMHETHCVLNHLRHFTSFLLSLFLLVLHIHCAPYCTDHNENEYYALKHCKKKKKKTHSVVQIKSSYMHNSPSCTMQSMAWQFPPTQQWITVIRVIIITIMSYLSYAQEILQLQHGIT